MHMIQVFYFTVSYINLQVFDCSVYVFVLGLRWLPLMQFYLHALLPHGNLETPGLGFSGQSKSCCPCLYRFPVGDVSSCQNFFKWGGFLPYSMSTLIPSVFMFEGDERGLGYGLFPLISSIFTD